MRTLAICDLCEQTFSPLASDRGAEVCSTCLNGNNNTILNLAEHAYIAEQFAEKLNNPQTTQLKIRDGWYALQTNELVKYAMGCFAIGVGSTLIVVALVLT